MGDSGRKACLSQARRGNRDRKGRMMGMEATEDHREASDKEIRRNGFGVWICNRAEKIKQAGVKNDVGALSPEISAAS